MASIKRQILKWFSDLAWMGKERIMQEVWQAKSMEKKARGRPRRTWNDEVVKYKYAPQC